MQRTWAHAPARTDAQWAAVLTALARAGDRPSQDDLSAAVTDPGFHHDAAHRDSGWARAATVVMESPRLPDTWPALKNTLATRGALAAFLEREGGHAAGEDHRGPPGGMTELADLVRGFAALLTPAQGNDAELTGWIADTRAADLPHLHSFANGLELDRSAVDAGLTLPYHNGRSEGVNTRTKRIMRQMHGRAGFTLLHQRILLH